MNGTVAMTPTHGPHGYVLCERCGEEVPEISKATEAGARLHIKCRPEEIKKREARLAQLKRLRDTAIGVLFGIVLATAGSTVAQMGIPPIPGGEMYRPMPMPMPRPYNPNNYYNYQNFQRLHPPMPPC